MGAAQAVLQLGSISIGVTMFDDISKRIIASFGESICLRVAARRAAERAAAAAAQACCHDPRCMATAAEQKDGLRLIP